MEDTVLRLYNYSFMLYPKEFPNVYVSLYSNMVFLKQSQWLEMVATSSKKWVTKGRLSVLNIQGVSECNELCVNTQEKLMKSELLTKIFEKHNPHVTKTSHICRVITHVNLEALALPLSIAQNLKTDKNLPSSLKTCFPSSTTTRFINIGAFKTMV